MLKPPGVGANHWWAIHTVSPHLISKVELCQSSPIWWQSNHHVCNHKNVNNTQLIKSHSRSPIFYCGYAISCAHLHCSFAACSVWYWSIHLMALASHTNLEDTWLLYVHSFNPHQRSPHYKAGKCQQTNLPMSQPVSYSLAFHHQICSIYASHNLQ